MKNIEYTVKKRKGKENENKKEELNKIKDICENYGNET